MRGRAPGRPCTVQERKIGPFVSNRHIQPNQGYLSQGLLELRPSVRAALRIRTHQPRLCLALRIHRAQTTAGKHSPRRGRSRRGNFELFLIS